MMANVSERSLRWSTAIATWIFLSSRTNWTQWWSARAVPVSHAL
jgi:hypothetical protein